MALTLSQAGSGNSTTSSATLAVTLTQSVAVGDVVIVCIASDNNGTNGADSVTSVTDSQSHTYTVRAGQNNDPGAAAAGASVNIYTTTVTTAMTTSDVVTANFSPNTASKAMVIWEVAPGAGETPTYTSNGGSTNNGTNPALTSSSITSGDAVIYALAAETAATLTGDSDTTRGSWSTLHSSVANTGTNGTSMTVGSQYKVVTGTGTQAWGTTLSTSDWGISYIVLHPAVVVSRTATGGGTGTESAAGGRFIAKSFLHAQFSTNFRAGGTAFYIGPRFTVFSRTATGSGVGTQTASAIEILPRTATGSGLGTQTVTGLHIAPRTATGSGTGTQTATGLHIAPRTATGSGAGTESSTRVYVAIRTATGAGVGTSNNSIVHGILRTGYASGGASTGDNAVGLHISPRTATGSGVSSELGYVPATGAFQRTATGSGVGSASTVSSFFSYVYNDGSSSATGTSSTITVHIKVRVATGAGLGGSSASITSTIIRQATASGVGIQVTVSVMTAMRTATGSGEGLEVTVSGKLKTVTGSSSGDGGSSSAWVKSHIFRVPYSYTYPGGQYRTGHTDNRLQRYNRTGVRARNLYQLTSGEYTTVDQRDQGQVVKLWAGGRDHFLSDAEVVELTAAGFGASIT